MNIRKLAVDAVGSTWIDPLLLAFLRIALAGPFWLSGRTKIEQGSFFSISETTYTLFANDYAGVPLPAELAAIMATVFEHVFPVLLVVGLATRMSALALIGMTLVIQLFVYPDAWWSVHMQWVALGLAILALGPGKWSLDSAIFRNRTP